MLFLLFHLGADRYALPARDVVEVLPLVALKAVPAAPRGVAGLLNYHGEPVPVLDLSLLAVGRPAAARVSTRLLLTRLAGAAPEQRVALLVERATEAAAIDPGAFLPAGVASPGARYLGPVANDGRGFIQRIELEALLDADLRAALALAVEKGAA